MIYSCSRMSCFLFFTFGVYSYQHVRLGRKASRSGCWWLLPHKILQRQQKTMITDQSNHLSRTWPARYFIPIESKRFDIKLSVERDFTISVVWGRIYIEKDGDLTIFISLKLELIMYVASKHVGNRYLRALQKLHYLPIIPHTF